MEGTTASAAILATFSAIVRACASLSITHGPAIRKRGLPPPRRNEPRLISLRADMSAFEDSTEARNVAKAGVPQLTCCSPGHSEGQRPEDTAVFRTLPENPGYALALWAARRAGA